MSPQIGIGVLIFREGKILLGRRKGSHGAGDWSAPGGHLEFGETPEICGIREAWEETGISTGKLLAGPYVSNVFPEIDKHYVTLFMLSLCSEGEPVLREPEKCEGWQWFSIDSLPEPLFAPLRTLIDQYGIHGYNGVVNS
ncbi:NUDIX hydrolase [Rouxiella sp. WC2420]|uniref:NUDIX hydrolase n=1 Tax=Rouxiella sp. WC2420 TaxID=3234145 RepID=A0AB39VSS9_9GAMM